MSLLTSAVSMTKAMVRIDSTDPGTYEKAMADWIEQQLSDLPNVIITRKEVLPGRPNLMAEISGPGELPALVMICHMDTVVIGDGWTMPPFEAIEKDGRIYGRGACDMKSGLPAACPLLSWLPEHSRLLARLRKGASNSSVPWMRKTLCAVQKPA